MRRSSKWNRMIGACLAVYLILQGVSYGKDLFPQKALDPVQDILYIYPLDVFRTSQTFRVKY